MLSPDKVSFNRLSNKWESIPNSICTRCLVYNVYMKEESFAPYLIKVLEIDAKLQLRNFRILLDFYKI